MKKRIIAIITGICLLAVAVQGQGSNPMPLPQQWTLQDCINYALQHNISVNSLRLSAQSSQQDLLQSKAALYPSVSGSVSQSLRPGSILSRL